jgi:hypothetical protein
METKACNLLYLNNATDTELLNNVRKENDLVLSRTSCSFLLFYFTTLTQLGKLHSVKYEDDRKS